MHLGYKKIKSVILAILLSASLIGPSIAAGDKNLDLSEASPIMVPAKSICFHPRAFDKHVVKARKFRVLMIKREDSHYRVVYVNNHGELLIAVQGVMINEKLIADCVMSSIADGEIMDPAGLKNQGDLPATPGPSGNTSRPILH